VNDSGGSELDLLRIIPGPPEVRDGHRLLLTLHFADAVLFRVEHAWTDDFPEWRLSDDIGTAYHELTYSGDDDGSAITFAPGVPSAASRLELAVDDLAFSVPSAIQEREPIAGSLDAAALSNAAEHETDLHTMARRGEARRVFVPDRVESHNRLAIVAVIACTAATEVVFHHVGQAQQHPAPTLRDDRGTTYTPVACTHVGSYHLGATTLTGIWRYQPPAPDTAAAFEVGGHWLLR